MRIGYARVSTADQNPDLQEDALQKAGCEKIFRDVASGAVDSRRGLAEAIDYARDGDTLVVWKLDRLGRSLKHLIETINGLAARKISFQSLRENMDTTTSGGKLIFHVFSALAEFERELIRERTQAGLRGARAREEMAVGQRRWIMFFVVLLNNSTRVATAGETLGAIIQWHHNQGYLRVESLTRYKKTAAFLSERKQQPVK